MRPRSHLAWLLALSSASCASPNNAVLEILFELPLDSPSADDDYHALPELRSAEVPFEPEWELTADYEGFPLSEDQAVDGWISVVSDAPELPDALHGKVYFCLSPRCEPRPLEIPTVRFRIDGPFERGRRTCTRVSIRRIPVAQSEADYVGDVGPCEAP